MNRISSRPKLHAICRALNKIFWKIPKPCDQTTDSFARFIVAELADANIDGIYWDDENEQFRAFNDGSIEELERLLK